MSLNLGKDSLLLNGPWGQALGVMPPRPWHLGDRWLGGEPARLGPRQELESPSVALASGVNARPILMGILNVTPDSFFDGGLHASVDAAVARAESLLAEGAEIIDVGGESSRPGAESVGFEEECVRVVPVITELRKRFDCVISIDTVKSEVARAALDAGALAINDISGGSVDPRIMALPHPYGAGFVINHMQGNPRTMQANPRYEDVVKDIADFFRERVALLTQFGLSPDRIALDPGIGFGKSREHNFSLLEKLQEFGALGYPVLVGHSRKSFIGLTPGLSDSDRLQPSIAVALYAALKGASILRVHDVGATWEALRMIAAIRNTAA